MADLSTFEHYYKLVDSLIEQSTKEQLAESALILALNLAHHSPYMEKYCKRRRLLSWTQQ